MQTQIAIGSNRNFALSQALLIYKGESHKEAFVTLHQVGRQQSGPPTIGPAEALTQGFLDSLLHAVGGYAAIEVLPENVLARTQQMLAWWVPARPQRMFFQHAQGVLDDISGQMFPQPPLVLRVDATGLSLSAREKNQRPQADTRMMVAPYWNTYATASVCLGSMRAPKQASVSAMERWETSFYESAFTHPNDAQTLTTLAQARRQQAAVPFQIPQPCQAVLGSVSERKALDADRTSAVPSPLGTACAHPDRRLGG